MTRPSLGMDHPHYEYLPLPARPRLMWPNGAPLAISIYLYLEYWAMEQGAGRVRDPRYNRRSFPDVLHHTWFEHGNRIDIFRVLDALSKHGFKISVATNAMAAERYTALIERLAAYNVEFVAHGLSATEMLNSRMNEHEERAFIDSSITQRRRPGFGRRVGSAKITGIQRERPNCCARRRYNIAPIGLTTTSRTG